MINQGYQDTGTNSEHDKLGSYLTDSPNAVNDQSDDLAIGNMDMDMVESSLNGFSSGIRTLIEFFVSIDQPLSVFENYRLRDFLADLNPNFSLPTSHTIESEYLPELVNFMEHDLRESLRFADHVAVTTNLIKTNDNMEYSGILVRLRFASN